MKDSLAAKSGVQDVVKDALRARADKRRATKAAAQAKAKEDAPRRECLTALGELAGIDPEEPDWWRCSYPKLLARAAKSYRTWKEGADLPDDPSLARPEFVVARALMTKAVGGAQSRSIMTACTAALEAMEEDRDRECLEGLLRFPRVLLGVLRGEKGGYARGPRPPKVQANAVELAVEEGRGHKTPQAEEADPFVCCFQGNQAVWNFSFGDEKCSLAHCAGFPRIRQLLLSPGHEVSIADMPRRVPIFRADAVADEEASKSYADRMKELEEIAADANQPAVCAQAREELAALKKRASAEWGIRGKSRSLRDDRQSYAQCVGKSIKRAITVLDEAGMSKMAEHLRTSIIHPFGLTPAYKPAELVSWLL